ncbi:MAG: hypothetical protein GXP37_03330 [Chloroflexi bacterium]|nr:hypothetical protein [Chloroflexota bacterium]
MAFHNEEILPTLLLITFLAALVPMVSLRLKRLHIPVVVGEIIVGIVIGKSGFNIVEPNLILDFLAWFGFIFLMFISGLELDFDLLSLPQDRKTSLLKQPVPLAGALFVITLALGLGVGFYLQQIGVVQDAILMGLILSTTSLGVVVPILKEHRIITSEFGQTLLVSALLADFITLLLFSVDVALLSKGLTLDLLLVLLLMVFFGIAIRGSRAVSNVPAIQRLSAEISQATSQIEVRGSFALMVAWAALAISLGAEVILGAFLAGALVSLLTKQHDSELREKLDAFGFGFFIPIFFIMVGVNFDASALLASRERLILVPLLLAAAFGIKLISALILRILFNWRQTLSAGMLLSARLSLIIAASAIALELQVIDEAMNAAIILTAIVTVTTAPILFERILRPAPHTESRQHFIIVSSSEMAVALAKRLAAEASVTLIAHKELRQNLPAGVQLVSSDAVDAEVLLQAGADRATGLVALSDDKSFNERACHLALENYGIENIVTWEHETENLKDLEQRGVRIIRPGMAILFALEGSLLFPAAYDLLAHNNRDMELREIRLRNHRFHHHSLREIHLPGDALVVGIQRREQRIVPHGDTVLQMEDILLLVGSPHALADAAAWLDESSQPSL